MYYILLGITQSVRVSHQCLSQVSERESYLVDAMLPAFVLPINKSIFRFSLGE